MGMPNTASVSVVIPCFRCANTVERAVFSIVQQTVLPEEVFLIEDCSNDEGETLDCLYRVQALYGDRLDLKIIRLDRNGGPGEARNAGWEAATSPYIAFLDADDAWHPRKLEIQMAWMESHPEATITGTHIAVISSFDNLPALAASHSVKEVSFKYMLFTNMLLTRSVIIRASIPHRFLPGKRYSEDYLLWLSVMADGHRAFLFEAPLAYAFKPDFGAGGLSAQLWMFHREVLDTYRRLYQNGHITGCMRVILGLYEFLKFLRRAALSS